MIEILTMTAWEKGCSSGTFKGDENIFLDLGNGYIVVLPKSTKPQIKVSLCILLYVKYTSTFKKEKVKKVHLKFQIRWPRRASCKGDICVKTCRGKKKRQAMGYLMEKPLGRRNNRFKPFSGNTTEIFEKQGGQCSCSRMNRRKIRQITRESDRKVSGGSQ